MKYFFLVFTFTSMITLAQSEEPIDQELDLCLSEAEHTADITTCFTTAWDKWDKELNDNYKVYKSLLSTNGQKQLIQAQRNWILFRDAEFKRIDQHYFQELGGTMWTAPALDEKLSIIKRRAIVFKTNIEDIKMAKAQ